MNSKTEKLQRFINDPVMSEAVKEVLLSAFLKPKKERDVHILAAQTLSVEALNDAWRDIERYKTLPDQIDKVLSQPGM